MNKAWKSVFSALAAFAVNIPTIAVAQDKGQGPDVPTAPFVAPIPDFFQWTITVTDRSYRTPKPQDPNNPATAKVPGEPIPKKVICTKTKDVVCNVILFSNGKHTEIWYNQGKVITRSASGEIAVDNAGGKSAGMFVSDLASPGFLGVDWVSLDNFVGKTKTKDGIDAFLYRSKVPSPKDDLRIPEFVRNQMKETKNQKADDLEATIAVDTKFPLVVTRGLRTYEYSYQTPPTAMIQLPPDLGAKVTQLNKQKQFIEALEALGRN